MARVGLMGVHCDNANMGVVALAYAAVGIVNDLVPGDADVVFFSANSDVELTRMADCLGMERQRVTTVPFHHKRPAALVNSIRQMRQCDVIVDFTGGDSFSDIYGLKRIVTKLLDKEMALTSGAPLVLAPQTIGPFQRRFVLRWGKRVINRASLVFARDELSRDFVAELTAREVVVSTDVAVTLPWDPDLYEFPPTERSRVGFNVSGLLWNGGYRGRNQFNLLTEYRDYCDAVVDNLLAEGLEVHLVPHVLSRRDAENEDDVAACRIVADRHPDCVLAPTFRSPVEAKSYISRMDVFIGSRMHATIASLTTGVPTVPVAYSRKFAGFFRNLGYPVLVDLAEMETGAAVDATMSHVRDRATLLGAVTESNGRAQERIGSFTARLAALLDSRTG